MIDMTFCNSADPIKNRKFSLLLAYHSFNGKRGLDIPRLEIAKSSWTLETDIKIHQNKMQFVFGNFKN